MTDLLELAARVEAAEASQQCALMLETITALNPLGEDGSTVTPEMMDAYKAWKPRADKAIQWAMSGAYESAAMTLVPENGWPGLQKNSGVPDHQRWDAWIETDGFGLFRCCAATPALALVAAALRSRSQGEKGDG